MKIGIILFIIGSILTLYFSKIKFEKSFFKKFGVIIGILILIYGIILMIQPKEYIVYTKTTISQNIN
jgi:uncharacterized membrane protein